MKAKVSIIGAGHVGSTTAHLILQSGMADVVLYDIAEGVPQGKALDLIEATPLWNVSATCKGTNDYRETSESDIVVITAGLPRKPGMSRDDLLSANAEIITAVVRETSRLSPKCIFVVVTNPMDVMTNLAWKVSGFEPHRIVGMGGVLDSARFRTFISIRLGISPEDVDAAVLGGHGDLMVPLPRFTTVKGVPISELLDKDIIDKLIERTRNGGAEIVALLKAGSAYYAPAAAIYQMTKAVLLDEKRVLPCAAYLEGHYGIRGIFVGVPVVLGRSGVERIIELNLREDEKDQFIKSANAVRALIETVLGK